VDFGDHTVNGKASSTDIVEAAAKAYLNCVNRYVVDRADTKNANALASPGKKKASAKK